MTNNGTYLETNRGLDPVIEDLYNELRSLFPEMSEGVLKSNGIFTKLLNDYIMGEITGIPEFLELRGYDYKGNILLNNTSVEIKPEAKEKVLNGEYFVGLKLFFEIEDGIMQEKKHLIFAKKKDKAGLEGLKDSLKNFIAGFMTPKSQN